MQFKIKMFIIIFILQLNRNGLYAKSLLPESVEIVESGSTTATTIASPDDSEHSNRISDGSIDSAPYTHTDSIKQYNSFTPISLNNITTIDGSENKNKTSANEMYSKVFYKSLRNGNKSAIDAIDGSLLIKRLSGFTSDYTNDSSVTASVNDDEVGDDDDDEENDELEGILDSNELKRFLVKYDTDDGNNCLLDSFKEDLLWWTFLNGTLKTINTKYSKNSYLDLSHENMSEDEDVLFQMRKVKKFKPHPIIVFSAAYNTLSSAPYQSLDYIKNSLKFLTLRGNQFQAFTAEMYAKERCQKNNNTNTNCRPTNSKHHDKCHQHIHNGDIYDRQPHPCHCNNTNTNNKNNNTITTQWGNVTYEEYIDYYKMKSRYFGSTKEGVAWATFPQLPELLELDISNCSIEYVTKEAFKNFTSLRRLFISQNKMMTIPQDTFEYVGKVQYLDLSFTNVLYYNYQVSTPTLEVALSLIYGLKIQQTTFKALPELIFLDVSHSKITRNSAVAFTHLGDKLKYLSLCYTAFPMVGNALFRNTALEGLDLSGNPFIAYNIIDDAFEGIADSLKYLYFEHSNLKELSWLKSLKKLRILGLAGNNINAVAHENFVPLVNLQVLDLSNNHIGNWYRSTFKDNNELRVLNLRNNNINIITTEMLKDFQMLDYLSLGENNFLCDCLLRELVDVSASNNKKPDCAHELLHMTQELLANNETMNVLFAHSPNISKLTTQAIYKHLPSVETINVDKSLWSRYVPLLEKSYQNINEYSPLKKIYKMRFLTDAIRATTCPKAVSYQLSEKLNDTTLKFQLLDYEEEHYWCYNESELLQVGELNCQMRMMVEEIASELHTVTTVVLAVVGTLIGLSLLGVLIYFKRWHIHYYYSSLKSAALLSTATKEAVDNFNNLSEQGSNMIYDVFISYCQSDRQWVLDELLPNVEESGDISICLHERDFKIGITILDNIISCMDRSRVIMLIISSKFLLSHWCQFEMYLAQHRIFEASKEHLVLVFLEDIPRTKRPKTLQYLMDIKTYIRWPTGKGSKQPKLEERKLFWKRLKRSLEYIGINTGYSRA